MGQLELFNESLGFERIKPLEWGYFLLISPGNEIKRLVKEMKVALHKEFGFPEHPYSSIAHISFFKFDGAENLDENILFKLGRVIGEVDSFQVSTLGITHFVHGPKARTFYLKASNDQKIEFIYRSLELVFDLKEAFVPHITISRMHPAAYHEATQVLLDRMFVPMSFNCDRLTLMKKRHREEGLRSNYELVCEFALRKK